MNFVDYLIGALAGAVIQVFVAVFLHQIIEKWERKSRINVQETPIQSEISCVSNFGGNCFMFQRPCAGKCDRYVPEIKVLNHNDPNRVRALVELNENEATIKNLKQEKKNVG